MNLLPHESTPALQALAVAAAQGANPFMGAYEDHYRVVHRLETSSMLRVGEIKLPSAMNALEIVKVGAILNDVCFVSLPLPPPSEQIDAMVHWLAPAGIKRTLGTDTIVLRYPTSAPEALLTAITNRQCSIGFAMPNDANANFLLKELSPLIEHCGVIPRPSRIFIYLQDTSPTGQRTFATIETPLGESMDTWDVRQIEPQQSSSPIAIQSEPKKLPSEEALCQIVVPYVQHISTKDFSLIIQDEADILVAFRSSIRRLTEEAIAQGRGIPQIINDVVRPSIANLERRFAHIVKMNRLKVGGAVMSTATLTLVSYVTTGVAAAVIALGGAAGLGYAAEKYASGLNELYSLKEDPVYLLWRLSRF